jgi:hypothetical protein
MLSGLDPHSRYMDPSSFRDIQVQTRGEFGGLGVEVTMVNGLLKVELAVVGFLDVVGAHPLEHFTEQIELSVVACSNPWQTRGRTRQRQPEG